MALRDEIEALADLRSTLEPDVARLLRKQDFAGPPDLSHIVAIQGLAIEVVWEALLLTADKVDAIG